MEDSQASAERGAGAAPAGPPAGSPAGSRSRGRHAGSAPSVVSSWLAEPGVALALGSVALAVVVGTAAAVGWGVLLVVLALLQVLFARAWVGYLEIPGATVAALAVVAVGAVADVGVVVAHLRVAPGDRPDGLVQLAPAVGVVFLAAVVAELARRDGRSGGLAGLVGAATGSVVVIGLAAWPALDASLAGDHYVVAGVVACAVIGVAVGLSGWVRRADVPAPSLLLPVLLALVVGPMYVLGRVVAG